MLNILEDAEKVIEGIKIGDWLIPVGAITAGLPILGYISNLLFKKFPGIKEFLKLICKTVCGGKECSEKQKKTKKVKTSKK